MKYQFAERVDLMKSSAIREILKVTQEPDMISFAGGLPAPELFPLAGIREAFQEALSSDPAVLQYSNTEGFLPLREYIVSKMQQDGINARAENVLITNGSQQALDLITKLFINPGDIVLVEKPSYLGALQVFRSYQAKFVDIATDYEGINVDAFELAIKEYHPKLIYLTPTFKNPTGVTLAADRRRAVAGLAAKYKVPLIEDDPYRELRYYGDPVPPIKSFDGSDWVIYMGSFSKIIAPGLRLGWVATEGELMDKLVLAKQGTDLHTGTLVQRGVYNYLVNHNIKAHIEAIRAEYGRRRDVMLQQMDEQFPKNFSWTKPDGGMFLWVTLPEGANSGSLLKQAIKEKVAYVPGAMFFPNGGGLNTLRLNFSNSTPVKIKAGIQRLARLLTE
ncbi:MAG: aminotransferase [Desulfotomaculum sp. BICA1-6]|nr:MAG: aminotransferase [Peptococcaceae bacterium BRH_c8a]KJS73541.1 MAG: aminotransferase [Desulfotomaculum sp. BICA1-6]